MCALVVALFVAGGASYARWVSPLLQYISACRATSDTTFLTNTKVSMAGGFKSKKERAADILRAARDLAADAYMSLASSNARASVGRRERGGRAVARRRGAIIISSCADHVRARIGETTTVYHFHSQVRKLRKKVASAEEAVEIMAGDGRQPKGRTKGAPRQKSSVE
jgi:hypothetical protein